MTTTLTSVTLAECIGEIVAPDPEVAETGARTSR